MPRSAWSPPSSEPAPAGPPSTAPAPCRGRACVRLAPPLVRGLAQQRPRRLLEDLPPGPGAPLLGLEVLHDVAHARGRDLDAVALADLAEARVAERQLGRHRLEAVAGDLHARREVHDRRLEHELVVGLGLDEDDVDARIALLPL